MSVASQIKKDTELAITEANRKALGRAGVKILDVSVDWEPNNMFGSVVTSKIAAGVIPLKAFMSNLMVKKCKRKEADALIIAGEKGSGGLWISGRITRVWVKRLKGN